MWNGACAVRSKTMDCVVEFISDVANHQIHAPRDLANPTAPKIHEIHNQIFGSSGHRKSSTAAAGYLGASSGG
jgi:hypothetical protein